MLQALGTQVISAWLAPAHKELSLDKLNSVPATQASLRLFLPCMSPSQNCDPLGTRRHIILL